MVKKADGGVAGLLGERTGYFTGALADTKQGKAMSPGTSADYTPGQGHRDTYQPPDKKVVNVPDKDPNQIMEQNLVTGKMMTRADLLAKKKYRDYVDAKGYYSSSEEDAEADALRAAWEKAGGMDTHMKNALVSSDMTMQQKAVDGKTIYDVNVGHSTHKDLDKDWTTRNTVVQDTAGNVYTNRLTPTGMWENDVYLGNRAPQSLAIQPYAEGGIAGMLGEPRSGYQGGGPTWSPGGSEFPILLNPFRPGGQKPGLSDYDDDVWDFDYIEIPMSGAMKR